MTENFYRTEYYRADHSAFGGRVYQKDFGGYTSMSDVSSRILSDRRFDQSCKRNTEYNGNGTFGSFTGRR